MLHAIARQQWVLHGVDASASGIRMARLANPAMSFWIGDVTGPLDQLGSPAGYFDVVISTEIIEHVYAPRNLAANMFATLRPGGKLIVSTPYPWVSQEPCRRSDR